MVDANGRGTGRDEHESDPLAALERLVNARTDQMTADMRPRAPLPSGGLRGAIEDLYGVPARSAVRREPPELPVGAASLASGLTQPSPTEAYDPVPSSDMPLPSLDALRSGWQDDLPTITEPVDDEPLPRILQTAEPAMPSGEREGAFDLAADAGLELEMQREIEQQLDTGLGEAVAGAMAAASAALAATQTQAPTAATPRPIEPLAVPETPVYDAPKPVEPISFGDDFERELVDELLQIEPTPAAPEADPLVGPIAGPHVLANAHDDAPYEADNDNGGRRRGAMIAAMLAAVAVIGGIGAFALNGGPAETTEVAIVRADPGPVKVRPADPGGRTVPNQSNAVYERVAEVETAQAKAPPAVAIVDETEDVSTLRESQIAATRVPSREVASAPTTIDVAPRDAIAPRAVRTIRVRPDGTLATMPPADASSPSRRATTAPAPVVTSDPQVAAADPIATPQEPLAALAGAAEELAVGIPVPNFRPYRIASASAPIAVPSSQALVAPAPPTGVTITSGPRYVVQIASVPNADAARRTYADLSGRYASLLGGRGVDYQVADIPGKGTFHRVRIPASSKSDANTLCSRLKASGGACFVTR